MHTARRIYARDGFSLIEVMIAIVVLTIGLTGAAGMQINAMRGAFSASSYSTGAGLSQAWIEWFSGLISQASQEPLSSSVFDGHSVANNMHQLSVFDTKPHDGEFTVLHPFCTGSTCTNCAPPDTGKDCSVLPQTNATIRTFLTAHHFTPAEGKGTFATADSVPPAPPPGSYMVWRIAANMPSAGVTTVEVSFKYRNAFVTDRGATLTVILGPAY